jgi:hypothetical protein
MSEETETKAVQGDEENRFRSVVETCIEERNVQKNKTHCRVSALSVPCL